MELTDSQYDGAGALEPAGGGYGKPSGAGENAKPAEGPGKGDGERLDLPVTYVNWREELAASGLPERERKSYEITLNWYLSFCKKARCRASKQSANAFIETVKRERAPERFQIAQWNNALRWFFRGAAAELPSETVKAEHSAREGGSGEQRTVGGR